MVSQLLAVCYGGDGYPTSHDKECRWLTSSSRCVTAERDGSPTPRNLLPWRADLKLAEQIVSSLWGLWEETKEGGWGAGGERDLNNPLRLGSYRRTGGRDLSK